ncbi:uncharacterized protein LOC135404066 [Pseudopipra pipra]|uniref:uncharacterized protein LOC135404066 n=1 Tax=Pseudopipra pipra TaxID=415032 RepID=UPI00313A3CEE
MLGKAPLGEPQCLAGAERACREAFTRSASGTILTEASAPSFPLVAVGVPDASGRTNPVAFMSSVLCCVCLQVTKLMEKKTKGLEAPSFPSVAVGVPDASLAGLTPWLLCPTCCAVCACRIATRGNTSEGLPSR